MTVRNILFFWIISLFLLIQCKSTDKNIYDNKSTVSKSTMGEEESNQKIDHWKTFEIFFTLKGEEDCIKITVASEQHDEIINKNVPIKTFFVIEKAVDISKLAAGRSVIFSEIERNYDYDWNTKKEVDICSSKTDPIKRLNKNNMFRIRFTTFRNNDFKYNIGIFSKHAVEYRSTY